MWPNRAEKHHVLSVAPGEFERTMGLDVDSPQRRLRAESFLTSAEYEPLLQGLNNYNPKEVIKFTLKYFKSKGMPTDEAMKKRAEKGKKLKTLQDENAPKRSKPRVNKDPRFPLLFTEDFRTQLRTENSLRFEKYVQISLYLALLEICHGDLVDAAWGIYKAMNNEKYADMAKEVEEGQFLLWKKLEGSKTMYEILRHRSDAAWREAVLERYKVFCSDIERSRIPIVPREILYS
ncbi:hypothetical protein PsorP6_001977 [Peronosclerospora sorghi]|uniref:Uncharacterized protein n=1 Tax=Peronosclerospora sorghi TaxID=230839 RepID=A0ACC0WR69_9STRA|nr:hypothetical protein PsorP6_001977 [Peronosclerospora sorghi]